MQFSYSYPENLDNSRPLQVINVDDERIQQREGSVDGKIVNVILKRQVHNVVESHGFTLNYVMGGGGRVGGLCKRGGTRSLEAMSAGGQMPPAEVVKSRWMIGSQNHPATPPAPGIP